MPGKWNHLTTIGDTRYRIVWKREDGAIQRSVYATEREATTQYARLLDAENVLWVRLESFRTIAHTARPGRETDE